MPSDAEAGRLSRLEVTPSGKIINNNDGLTVLRHPARRRSSSRSLRPQKVAQVVTRRKSPEKNEDDIHENVNAKSTSRKASKTGKSSVTKKKSKTTTAHHEERSIIKGQKKGPKKSLSASNSDSLNDTVKENKFGKAGLEKGKAPHRTATLPRVSAKIRKARSSRKSVVRRTSSSEPDASNSTNLKNSQAEDNPKVSQSSHVNIRSLRVVGRRSKSRTATKQDWDDNKTEPAFFQKITPDFYARLRQVASETPANILSSLKQARKNQLAKLETLTSLHDKEKKPNKVTKGQLSYAEAREALSFSKPAPLQDPTKRPDEDNSKISSEPENVAKPLNSGLVVTSKHKNNTPTSGILCRGFSCGAKKRLRFAESTKELPAEVSHSNSNNTRRLSCNVLGGCMK